VRLFAHCLDEPCAENGSGCWSPASVRRYGIDLEPVRVGVVVDKVAVE
jgi:hypothetical protein